jgi:hypothetical protein
MKGGGGWAASIGAVVGYALATLIPQLPRIYFYPLRGMWALTVIPDEPTIRWYGSILYALAGGLLGMALGRWLPRRSAAWHLVWIVAVVALLVMGWNERHWFVGG